MLFLLLAASLIASDDAVSSHYGQYGRRIETWESSHSTSLIMPFYIYLLSLVIMSL